MSKVAKSMNKVTKTVFEAGGVAAKHTGEAVSKAGRAIGVSDETCQKIENKSDDFGKDVYYASRKAGKKVEEFVDDVVDDTKRVVKSVKEKFK